jgi:FKBP-type peptidyl-prolyl cis-trans isomerase FklB
MAFLRGLVALALLVAQAFAGTNEVGLKFLEENAQRPGVITLPSGLQYKVLREGTGQDHPTVNSPCECHYAGTTPSLTPDAIDKEEKDWAEFDSSYKRGSTTTFAPNQVIKGWTEAMQLMVEGDKWEMYIPSDLGYGDGGSGAKIQGGDVLIFRMEIVKIKGDKKPADKCDTETSAGCNDKQKAYLEKHSKSSPEKRSAELKRLEGMQGGEMKPENRNWLVSRIRLLTKMVKKDEL